MPKPDQFEISGSLWIERSLRREGPSPVYVAWVPNSSRLFYEKKPLLKFCKWPASTQSGQDLRVWLNSFDDDTPKETESNISKIQSDNWGPEGHAEEPNDNTRSVI